MNDTKGLTLSLLLGAAIALTGCDVFDNDGDTERLANPRVSDATVVEGNDGTVAQRFTVTVDRGAGPIQFSVNTVDDTAVAGADYAGIVDGRVTVPAGATSATVLVSIIGDEAFEPDESFFLDVATLEGRPESARGVGTIRNDDLEQDVRVQATYTYDALNRITSVSYSNGKTVEYTYDAAGNVLLVDVPPR